ncbi:MAG: 4Fe-4S dicluster domain-containing protein [Desulfuromonadales bacterium]|nr:4Fe-4S dicluster domain-containing protein [Desulfuromonadales bacterium]
MGHHLGSKSSIVPLIDRLNKYPIGLVDSEKLRQILAILFSEEEAYIASRFPLEEATLAELARLTEVDETCLEQILNTMADKGLVMDLPYGKQTYYLLMPGLIGFFEFTFMKQRADLPVAELARLMHDYLHDDPQTGQAKEFFGSKTQLTRAIPYDEHVPVSSSVTTYESAREIIKNATFGAVGMCYCRHKKQHLDESCPKGAPLENICISLGTGARFLARRGFAEQKSTEELLAIIDRAHELNLTHITDNIRHQPSFICNCCSCCCELLAGIHEGYCDGVAKANFIVQVDAASCTDCGLCTRACNAKALELRGANEKRLKILEEVCLGCGACISSCPSGALSLVPMRRPDPPHRKKDLFLSILKEKKRLKPFVIGRLKKGLRRPFTKN